MSNLNIEKKLKTEENTKMSNSTFRKISLKKLNKFNTRSSTAKSKNYPPQAQMSFFDSSKLNSKRPTGNSNFSLGDFKKHLKSDSNSITENYHSPQNPTDCQNPFELKSFCVGTCQSNSNCKSQCLKESLAFVKEELICGKNCENLPLIKKYESLIKDLMYENEKLKKINLFFMTSMSRKDDYLLTLLKHNGNLSTELNSVTRRGGDISDINGINGLFNQLYNNSNPASTNRGASARGGNVSNRGNNPHANKDIKSLSPKLTYKQDDILPQSTKSNKSRKSIQVRRLTVRKLESQVKEDKEIEINSKSETPNKLFSSSKILSNSVNVNNPNTKNDGAIGETKYLSFVNKLVKESKKENDCQSGSITNVNNNNAININFNSLSNSLISGSLIKSKRTKSVFHYDTLLDMFNKKNKKGGMRDQRCSFLSASNQILNKMIAQDLIREILKMTNNDDEFINAMRSITDDKLIMFADSVSVLIKDYEYSLTLIKRIKSFLQVSIRVVNTMILEDAINMVIKNSCEILDCDRTSIFVHDKFTNMLVIHAGEGLKKNTWKIPPDSGIVGYVFTTGERQKIDDAYLDRRFNRDVDKKTGFVTRSMLCVPLKDEDGRSFGVIQALNKKNGLLFSADDEELMDVFANQASAILKNSMKFDENLSHISRMKMLLNFSIQIHTCTTLFEFTSMGEHLLASFWGTSISQILLHDENNNKLRHYVSENKFIEKPNNIGLIGRVFKIREIIAINSGYDNSHFNNLIDLESGFSLITFPFYYSNDETKLFAVGQVGYPFKIFNKMNRPREMDDDVIHFFSSISSFWLTEFMKKNNNTLIV